MLELAPAHAWTLGPIVFVLCEFQLIDRETEAANELGEASHARYKERQKGAVMRRLKIGTRELYTPPGASRPPKSPETKPSAEPSDPRDKPRAPTLAKGATDRRRPPGGTKNDRHKLPR